MAGEWTYTWFIVHAPQTHQQRMLKYPILFVALIAAAVAGSSHAAPRWDRYTTLGSEPVISGVYPDNRGGMPPQVQSNPQQFGNAPLDTRQPPGRGMSIEERRNLRRQINEAGQDIYIQRQRR